METSAAELPRGTVTFLFTDIEGPPLKSADRVPARPAIISLLFTELVTASVTAEHGRVLEVVGDSTVSRFEWPREALRAAAAIRDGLETEQWVPGDDRPLVRMAIHSGGPCASSSWSRRSTVRA